MVIHHTGRPGSKGDTGERGETGPMGPQGPVGPMPVFPCRTCVIEGETYTIISIPTTMGWKDLAFCEVDGVSIQRPMPQNCPSAQQTTCAPVKTPTCSTDYPAYPGDGQVVVEESEDETCGGCPSESHC